MEKVYDLVIITPVYNDWESLNSLLLEIGKLKKVPHDIMVIAVNDGSTDDHKLKEIKSDIPVRILHLARNMGHQKAIAIGLTHAVHELRFSYAIVMDSDGEDRPLDIEQLWALAQQNKPAIIFAKRTKRNEDLQFRFGYYLYKFLFKMLTGIPISFGNFCILPYALAKKVIHVSEIWNHFSAGVIRSKIPYILMPAERGKRFLGKSKMNFHSLVLHGLSSLSVHIDIVAVRLITSSVSLLFISLLAIVVVAGIRIFTTLAVPGWTSSVVLGFSVIFLQSLFFSVLLVFIILSYRTQRNFIPALDYQAMISNIEIL